MQGWEFALLLFTLLLQIASHSFAPNRFSLFCSKSLHTLLLQIASHSFAPNRFSLFRSKSLSLKSDCEQYTLVTL